MGKHANMLEAHRRNAQEHVVRAGAYGTCVSVARADGQHALADKFQQYQREALQTAAISYSHAGEDKLAADCARYAQAIPPRGWSHADTSTGTEQGQ